MLTKGSLSTALQLLRSPNGKKATEELWKSGVRHQIVLYVSLSGGAQLNEIDTIVALRKEFDSQQEKLKSQPGDYAYYFVGVLAQYSGNAASDSLVKTHFQRMLL
ncbi:uncharacterized protein LOC135376909, partial [Ornithodoros turicata]|uniref:uncharacterized protein LOC135376909 n=1 Tax=Ornithodoros turicata TaxID=34597 RepID=UPI00313996E2